MPPASEAQKRASKKWRENNKEQFLTIVYAWRKNNPEYKEKQYGYIKKSRNRKAALLQEFKRLSAILL